ncbi:hypothetical protein PIB30_095976 [Stylosanthes scabra]|uniref:Uncharacterized protein n=1 Tax=Stylosanthes scabra TaxID=79078 RepID=A0ABU6QW78_9FABA|nr:hypothetical protein [Stylosanthes scabra]
MNIQASLYGSRVFFHPTFPEAVEFRNSLLNLGKQATQPISYLQSQGQRSMIEEISSGEIPLHTIEDVYNMTEVKMIGLIPLAKDATKK